MSPTEPTPPEDPAVHRRKGFGAGYWIAMGFCFACIIAAVFVGFFLHRILPAPENDTDQSSISAPIPAIASEPVDMAVAPQIGIEQPLVDLDDPAEDSSLEVGELVRRVRQLEANQSRVTEAAAAALSASALLQAAQTSQPFMSELEAVEKSLPNAVDYGALRRLAETGAPTLASLSADFADAASRAVTAGRRPGENAGLWRRVSHGLGSIVTIRRIDYAEGQGVDAILARAENLLQAGDLAGALDELAALPEGARVAMSGWLDGASRRAELDQRLTGLREAALRTLGPALEAGS